MGTLKKYRFKLAWQNFRAGAVIEPAGVLRDWLLSNGYIEPADQPAPTVPQAPPEAREPVPAVRKRQKGSVL